MTTVTFVTFNVLFSTVTLLSEEMIEASSVTKLSVWVTTVSLCVTIVVTVEVLLLVVFVERSGTCNAITFFFKNHFLTWPIYVL